MARYVTSEPSWVIDRLIPADGEFDAPDDVKPAKCWKRIDKDDDEEVAPRRRGLRAKVASDDDI